MFYNELSAKYLFWTCHAVHSVFFRYSRNYLVAVSACISHKWPRYIVSLFETGIPSHALFLLKLPLSSLLCFGNLGTAIFKKQFSKQSFELWSNLWNQPVTQLVFTRVPSKQWKIAVVITVEYNLPTNWIKINSIESAQSKVRNNGIS